MRLLFKSNVSLRFGERSAVKVARYVRRGQGTGDRPALPYQMDSRHGVLIGHRNGDTFYCFDGVVLHADQNAARNVLARKEDSEIQLWTPFLKVKSILHKRTERFKKRMGLLIQDTSCKAVQLFLPFYQP
jgi:hypothetical protein